MISIAQATADPRPQAPIPARVEVRSEDLLRGARQMVILHDGQEYRLQVTKNGKLILTK